MSLDVYKVENRSEFITQILLHLHTTFNLIIGFATFSTVYSCLFLSIHFVSISLVVVVVVLQ